VLMPESSPQDRDAITRRNQQEQQQQAKEAPEC
jgi:hypothetical protein